MRITYRSKGVKEYWQNRWDQISVDMPMENTEVYPLKYAERIVGSKDDVILEAGCGAGRILRYFHNRGYKIFGIDYIPVAIEKLKMVEPSLEVKVGNITQLDFPDESFDCCMAFGLLHNLEEGLNHGIAELSRVLRRGGKLVASFRADNIQNRLNDWLVEKSAFLQNEKRVFHKMNLTRQELRTVFEGAGFVIESVESVENMPILYKLSLFRAKNHKDFDETRARVEGYCLNRIGKLLQRTIMNFFPDQFCNVYVLFCVKHP